jgi:hypothetical protein
MDGHSQHRSWFRTEWNCPYLWYADEVRDLDPPVTFIVFSNFFGCYKDSNEGTYFNPSLLSKKAIWIGSNRRRKECLVTIFETMLFMLTFGRLSWHLSVQRQEFTKKKCRSKFMFTFIGKDLALETGLCRIWI